MNLLSLSGEGEGDGRAALPAQGTGVAPVTTGAYQSGASAAPGSISLAFGTSGKPVTTGQGTAQSAKVRAVPQPTSQPLSDKEGNDG